MHTFLAKTEEDPLEDISDLFRTPTLSSATSKPKPAIQIANQEVIFENPPVFKFQVYDHVLNFTRLYVVMDSFSGASSLEFTFNDDGSVIYLESNWSSQLIDVDDLLDDELQKDNPNLPAVQHKCQAFKTALLDHGITKSSIVRQKITIPLGMIVVKDESAYDVKIKKKGNKRTIIFEFRAFQQSVVVQAATKRKFNLD